jgi:hypothetical protein
MLPVDVHKVLYLPISTLCREFSTKPKNSVETLFPTGLWQSAKTIELRELWRREAIF